LGGTSERRVDDADQEDSEPDYRFTLANERTFLAWQRTALGLLAAAIAVVQLVPELAVPGARHVIGALLAALAIITVTDPIVSIAVGIVWLGETVHGGPADIAGELVALAVLVASVFLLAERAPKVKGEDQPERQAGSAAAASQNAG